MKCNRWMRSTPISISLYSGGCAVTSFQPRRNISTSEPASPNRLPTIPAGILLIRVRAFMLYEQRRIEVSEESDIFEEMFQFRDWTAVDRVFQL